MAEIVAVDVGGTHARFALAEVAGGRVLSLGEPCILKTADFDGLEGAWQAFRARQSGALPDAAGIALAGPVGGEEVKLTNGAWTIDVASIPRRLGIEHFTLINDFGAVAHAVAQLDGEWLRPLCGPAGPLPEEGAISVIGPGTGLGVALLLRSAQGYRVIETEAGHVGFAPLDGLEDRLLAELRKRFGRVSVERVVSGPGLRNLHEALAGIERRAVHFHDDKAMWQAAIAGEDSLAAAALDRFCLSLGAFAGDIALAHGASAVAIGGGVGLRLAERLPDSGFRDRFVAKGRYTGLMERIPVKVITHGEPGLFGAAAAFAQRYPD